jgi:hypothetical protein
MRTLPKPYIYLHAGCGASISTVEDLDLHFGTHFEVPYVSNNDRFDYHPHADIVTPELGYNYQATVPPTVAISARPATDPIPSMVSANGPGHSQLDAIPRPLPVCAAYSHDLGRVPDLECHAKKHQPGAKICQCDAQGCGYPGSYDKDELKQHKKNLS